MPPVAIPPAYESSGYRRFLAFDGTPYPGRLAVELPVELIIVDEPATSSRPARSRLTFIGMPGGSVPLTRQVNGSSPIRINNVGAADLTADITVSILPASGSTAGSMSTAHFNFLTNLLTASVPTNIVPDDAADPGGSVVFAARADHTHGIATDSAGAIAVGDTAAEGVGVAFARNDHRHALPAPAAPTTIQPDDSASAGVATTVARADHRHAIAAAAPGTIALGDSPTEGASTSFARADHVHGMPQLAVNPVVGANTLTGTTTTRYLAAFTTGTASVSPLDMPVCRPFTVTRFCLFFRVAGSAGANISYTLRKNGAAVPAATITVASDAPAGVVYPGSAFAAVSFAQGDTWGVEVTKSAGIASSPTDVMLTVMQNIS